MKRIVVRHYIMTLYGYIQAMGTFHDNGNSPPHVMTGPILRNCLNWSTSSCIESM